MTKLKREWIKDPAKVMIIQVNRVDFDVTNKKTLKNNKMFTFDEVLFVDQFLEKNRQEIMRLDLKNNELNTELKSLDFQLNQFTAFGPQKVNLLAALSTVTFFLSQQSNYKDTGSKLYDKKFGKIDKTKFSQSYDAVTSNFNILQKNKNDVIMKKKMLYENIKKTKYNLKGVIIHEGDNNHGHYYAYIKNDGRWWQFNDRLVTEVDRRRVFDDAYGNIYEERNVYCLVYTHDSMDINLILSHVSLPRSLIQFVSDRNIEIKTREIEKDMDDLIVKMQVKEREIRNSNSFLEFRRLVPRIECFELFCIDSLHRGVTNPSSYMDTTRVSILDDLLRKVNTDAISNADLNYFNLKNNPDVYKALEKALIKYRIDLPEPSESCLKLLKRFRLDYVDTIKAVVVLGTAIQSLAPSSMNDYANLLAYYFSIKNFGVTAFNEDHYKILKENTLYFIIQAHYLRKTQKQKFSLQDFVHCIRICLQILTEMKLLDPTPGDYTDNYIIYLTIEIDSFIAGYPGWDKVMELVRCFKNSALEKKTFTLQSLPKSDHVLVI